MSYTGHLLVGGSYPSAEKRLVYSTAPANWTDEIRNKNFEMENTDKTDTYLPWKNYILCQLVGSDEW